MKPRFNSPFFAVAATLLVLPAANAATWTGATDSSWATPTNWSDNAAPNGTITYDATSTANLTQALNGSYTVTGITLGSPTAAVTIGHSTGNILSLGSGGIDMSAANFNLTILNSAAAGNIDIAANQTWNINTGRTATLFNGSNTLNARLTGSANIEKTGAGTVLMSVGDSTATGTGLDNNGNDTFTGNWTISAGKVQSQRNATHAWGRGGITLNGGTITQTNGTWTWSNNIDVSAASVIGTDSSSGLGRTLKLVGNLTSSNSSGLTFTNSTTGGTRTDNVGFLLAGANASTYTTTTISANSRVRVGGNDTASVTSPGFNAGNRGSLGTGDVTLSATTSELGFTRTDAHSVGNKITGLGTVVIGGNTTEQAGTSTQVVTLSGVSDYTGATRVSRSRLNLTGSLTSAITVDNSGSISGTGSTTGLLTLASGSKIALAGGATTTSITANGSTFGGSNVVTFLSNPVNTTVYDVFTYGAGSVTNIVNLTVPYRGTFANDPGNLKYTFTAGEYGATRTWNTTSGSWAVNSGTNFAEGDQKFFAGDNVVFGNIASDATVTLTAPILPASVAVNNAANTYTFAGGAMDGSTTLSKSGAGTLALSVANTFSGGATVSGGTLKLGNAGALGTGTATVSSGGTLDVAGFAATNAISLSGTGNGTNPALWNSAATFTTLTGAITLNADSTVGNSTTDRGTRFNPGPLDLNGNKLSFTAGAVSFDIQRIPSGNIDINSGGTLYSENGGSLTSVTGIIKVNTGGKFETRDTNNTSMTTVHTIQLNGGQLGTATITNNNGGGGGTTLKNNIEVDATNGGTLNGNNTGFGQNLRLTGELSGSGALTLTGAQGIELRGEAVNYTGTATANNGTLFFNPTTSQSFGGVIAGTRPVTKSGAGTTTLLGANTYTANTSVTAGTLELANNAQLKFVLGATSGSNNSLTGAGTVTLNGDFVIDTTAADALASGTWTLENVTTLTGGAYGSGFQVFQTDGTTPWTDAGGNKWTKTNGPTKLYTFDETTGVLTLSTLGYAAWQTANSTNQTIDQDHDNDGVSNGVEFFLGGPNDTTGFTAQPAIAGTSVTYAKHPDYPGTYGTNFEIETSETLVGAWTPETVGGNVVQTVNNFTYTFPGGGPAKKFVRLKVTGP